MPAVLLPIADGTEELEAISIVNPLRRAGCDVTIASIKDDLTCKCAQGTTIIADKLFSEVKDGEYDLVVLPGGGDGANAMRDCASLVELLKARKAAGKLIAAICASPAVNKYSFDNRSFL